jgi:hypothetical protein
MDRDALLQRYRDGPDRLEAAALGLSDDWLEIYAAHCHDHADQISWAVEESRLAQQ